MPISRTQASRGDRHRRRNTTKTTISWSLLAICVLQIFIYASVSFTAEASQEFLLREQHQSLLQSNVQFFSTTLHLSLLEKLYRSRESKALFARCVQILTSLKSPEELLPRDPSHFQLERIFLPTPAEPNERNHYV